MDSDDKIRKIREDILPKLELFRVLGSDKDLDNSCLWLLLENPRVKTKKAFPNIITIHELLDVDAKDFLKGFNREWEKIFLSAKSLGEGLYSPS